MGNRQNSRELVAVPVRRLPVKEHRAQRLGEPLPYDAALRQPIPRRWRVY